MIERSELVDRKRVARELMRLAKQLNAAPKTLADYDGEGDLADELADELSRYINGASDENDGEIRFYEDETRKGVPVSIEIIINPLNQHWTPGEVKVGLSIYNDAHRFWDSIAEVEESRGAEFAKYLSRLGSSLEDGIWKFDDTDTVKDVAKVIGGVVQKALKKW